MYKDTNCGDITLDRVGDFVIVAGWVSKRRDHGNLIFIDLRDRSGILQIVFNPKNSEESHNLSEKLRNEWVIQVSGTISKRKEGAENNDLKTGQIELSATELKILSPSKTPPFEIIDELNIDDLTRLKYRFLDLRRPKMQNLLKLRHNVTREIWDYLSDKDFIQIETPVLMKSTPEGARDYVVPSRLHPGQFYALPQSPQQLKQILMVSGIEKYFQIAHCFRDEDLRADRQPEHTQLDLEMSYVHKKDVIELVEGLFISIVEKVVPNAKFDKPFLRISYDESIERFGTDKPDTRYGLELKTISKIVTNIGINVFDSVIENGGIVRSIVLPDCGEYTRKQTDELIEFSKLSGGKGLVFIGLDNNLESLENIQEDQYRSSLKKFLSVDVVKKIYDFTGAKSGDLVLIVADQAKIVNNVLSAIRTRMGKELNLFDDNKFNFVWVDDFPLFEWDELESKWIPAHHVFSSPKEEDLTYLENDPGKIKAELYDLVCNGYELGSGSIRIHDRDIQTRVFNVIGYKKEDIDTRFGHLLRSFDYGAPPHGGMGLGLDRLVMLLGGQDNIREVIAFPKTQTASDPLFDSPSNIDSNQLRELGISFPDLDKN